MGDGEEGVVRGAAAPKEPIQGCDMGLEVETNFSRLWFDPRDLDLNLEAGI